MSAVAKDHLPALLDKLPPDSLLKALIESLPPEKLARKITLPEACQVTSLSKDSLLRNYRHLFVNLSERRIGMAFIDAVLIGYQASQKQSK